MRRSAAAWNWPLHRATASNPPGYQAVRWRPDGPLLRAPAGPQERGRGRVGRKARFGWELGPAGTDAVVAGFDLARRDGDGRLALVLGFLDKVPSA